MPAGRPRADDAEPDAGRGHVDRRAARRHRLGLRDLPRVPGAAARRRLAWPTSPPTSATRRCAPGSWAATRRSAPPRADEIAQMQAIVREAMAHGAVGFASSTSPAHNGEGGLPMPSRLASDAEMAALVGAMGEGGRGVYMLTKGGHTPVPVPRVARRGDRPAGDGRGAAAQQRQSARGVRRPRRDRRRQRARPSPARPGVVLPADDGLHARLAVSGRRPGELEAGARPRGAALEAVLADPAFRDGVRAELATPTTFRLFNSEWDKVQVVETARPRARSASSSARSPRSPPRPAATRSTRCSTSRSPTT